VQASFKKAGVLDGSGADDDVAQAAVDVFFDRVQIADAAAQLHRDVVAHGLEDGLDGREVLRLAGKCAVQVHQVQAACAFFEPGARHRRRVFAKGRGLVHIALLEANAVAVFEVNGGDQNHGELKKKLKG